MPATNQKKAQGAESRLRLIEAAAELVSGGGYSAASVDAVAKRAGVVKSALYWHFGSKNGLLLAALEQYTADWVSETEAAVEETRDPITRLDKLLAHVRSLIVERPHSRRMVFAMLIERGQEDPECRSAVRDVFERLRASLTTGFAEVLPVPPERIESIADAVVCICDGVFLRYMSDPDTERLDRQLAEIRRMVVLRVGHELQRTLKKNKKKK